MEQGEVEKRIVQQCMRDKLPLPARIQNAPDLPLGMEMFYSAFIELNSCRPSGFGIQPIHWTVIRDYCSAHDLDDEETEDLFFFVTSLDRVFREYHEKKSRKK